MKTSFFLFAFILCPHLLLCQPKSPFGVICSEFTLNKKKFEKGEEFKNILEGAISESGLPFVVLERDDIDIYIEKLQEERNLVEDHGGELKETKVAEADYFAKGNIMKEFGASEYTVYINFIRLTGELTTQKLPMFFTVPEEEINNAQQVKKNMLFGLQSFYESFFTETDNLTSWNDVPNFLVELQKRDSILNQYRKSLQEKEERILELELVEQKRKVEEEKLAKLKRTAPVIDAHLHIMDSSLYMFVEIKNKVPVEIIYGVFTEGYPFPIDGYLPSAEPKTLYPQDSKKWLVLFYQSLDKLYSPDNNLDYEIKMVVDYSSIYYPEYLGKDLTGTVTKNYMLNISDKRLKRID